MDRWPFVLLVLSIAVSIYLLWRQAKQSKIIHLKKPIEEYLPPDYIALLTFRLGKSIWALSLIVLGGLLLWGRAEVSQLRALFDEQKTASENATKIVQNELDSLRRLSKELEIIPEKIREEEKTLTQRVLLMTDNALARISSTVAKDQALLGIYTKALKTDQASQQKTLQLIQSEFTDLKNKSEEFDEKWYGALSIIVFDKKSELVLEGGEILKIYFKESDSEGVPIESLEIRDESDRLLYSKKNPKIGAKIKFPADNAKYEMWIRFVLDTKTERTDQIGLNFRKLADL